MSVSCMSESEGRVVRQLALALVVWLGAGEALPARAAATSFATPQVLKEFFPKSERVT